MSDWGIPAMMKVTRFYFLSFFLYYSFALIGCTSQSLVPNTTEKLHQAYWKDRESYETLFGSPLAKEAAPLSEKIDGAIMPHHLFVGHEIARFYNALKNQQPSVVVIIGPNHFDQGRGAIQTTNNAFETPYGTLPISPHVLEELLMEGGISLEPQTFDTEHSISTHVAFIKRMFPNTEIVPLVIKVGTSGQVTTKLSETLVDVLPPDALVLASVDFSHYLPKEVASFHDEYSHAVIEQFELGYVHNLEIDSPESINVLLRYLNKKGAQHIVYDRHTNSADFVAGLQPSETTSHFFMAFSEGKAKVYPFVSLLFLGDTIVDRGIKDILGRGEDPLSKIRGKENRFFRGVMHIALNLEGPISASQNISVHKIVTFAFDPIQTINLLKEMHITIINSVNNHMLDAGKQGIYDTQKALENANIIPNGIQDPCSFIPVIHGTLAVCSFIDLNDLINVDMAKRTILDAHSKADYVVISMHWGREYVSFPSKHQRFIAAEFIRLGADAIIGHGPHIRQALEFIEEKPVFFSVGNFLFDQANPMLSNGSAAALTFSGTTITTKEFLLKTNGGYPSLLQNASSAKSDSR